MNNQFDRTPYSKDQLDFIKSVQPLLANVWSVDTFNGIELRKEKGLFTAYSLFIDDLCWMTSNALDLLDHRSILEDAYGDVLLTGLGMGLGVIYAAENPQVTSITVIERDQRILDLIVPMLSHLTFSVIIADADEYAAGEYDFVFIDHAYARPDQDVIDKLSELASNSVVWFDERMKLESKVSA